MNFGKVWNNENCYRYAIHCTTAEGGAYGENPGDFSNSNFDIFTVEGMRNAIVADGATFINGSQHRDVTAVPPHLANHYVIAVSTGQMNYHVVRRNETATPANGQRYWYGKLRGGDPGPWDENNWPDVHNMQWSSPRVGPAGFPHWVGYFYVPTLGLRPPRNMGSCCVIM